MRHKSMKKLGLTLMLLTAGAILAHSQDARPVFEAASVKPNVSGDSGSSEHGSKGQVVVTNQTFKRLVERAYDVKPFQVMGPGWIETLRFDISAKYPSDMKPDEGPLMLRALLEERFQLAAHRESKNLPGYALVVAKGAFKLKPVAPGGSQTEGTAVSLTAKRTSMADLATFAARGTGETVVDQTGIAGVYDFELKWTLDPPTNDTASDRASILFTALEETLKDTLGVRLQRKKAPVEMVVIDKAERQPTGN